MSIPVDPNFIELVAADLGVAPAFIEKDWHAMRLVALVLKISDPNFTPVFSGGTSLSKGFNLIQRFSEDLDFKMLLPKEALNTRNQRRNYRNRLVQLIRREAGWLLEESNIMSRNNSRFFSLSVAYESVYQAHDSLRPDLKLEMSFVSPNWSAEQRSLQSFIAQAQGEEPEIPAILCVSPVETAADKLSALTWRVLSRQRGTSGDDPALIRHLYDLAVLEEPVRNSDRFPELARSLLQQDRRRGQQNTRIQDMTPAERVSEAFNFLKKDAEYEQEYRRFVEGMSYAANEEVQSFFEAIETVQKFQDLL